MYARLKFLGTQIPFRDPAQISDDQFWNHVEHINDLYYNAGAHEVANHQHLPPESQWTADVTVDVERFLPIVRRAMAQQERWADIHRV